MKILSKNKVILINKHTIRAHGGNFIEPYNFLHEDNLDYLIDIIDAQMFGVPLYPNVWDRAALYLYNIVCNHIFSDGNKRTGLEAALLFLAINGYQLKENLDDEILNFVIQVASGEKKLEECQEWFKTHIEPL